MSRRAGARWPAMVALLGAAAWACMDVTDVELIQIVGSGVLVGQAFLDLDGDSTISAGDEPIVDADVTLVTSGTADVVQQAVTDSLGLFTFFDVPVGSYRLTLDTAVLSDSLTEVGATGAITVALDDTTRVDLGASYPELSLEAALLAPLGRRIFTSGIALNSRVNFGDGQVHFRGDSAFLRGLNVERGALTPGDSARLLGRVVIDNGRPALDQVTFDVRVPAAAVVTPVETSTGVAATADSGALDAALARIRNAELTDTGTTAEGHFRFWADDGSDSVEVVIRDFLLPSIDKSVFRPDTIVRVRQTIGLLSPFDDGTGTVRWRLLPRAGGDISLENKLADIAVSTSFGTPTASTGDTVEISVTVSNGGPLTATSVQVSDTIPTGSSFVSALATTGTYDSGSGLWDVGTLDPGMADTLRIRVEVTAVAPATVVNIAESLGLVLEVDPQTNNDSATASLPIS